MFLGMLYDFGHFPLHRIERWSEPYITRSTPAQEIVSQKTGSQPTAELSILRFSCFLAASMASRTPSMTPEWPRITDSFGNSFATSALRLGLACSPRPQ